MDLTPWLALVVIVAAVVGVMRGIDVRLVLLLAALTLGALAGDLAPIVREFLATFSSEKFVVPICAAMGFAYVLRLTGCDTQLVRLLVAPVRRARGLLVPGVVVIGFLVNVPIISQTSTAICLGTVVVPLMRAAGFSPVTIGAALLLGASVGGELLNPGAPELLTISVKTGVPTTGMWRQLLPLVLPVLVTSTLVLWLIELRTPRSEPTPTEEPTTTVPIRLNPLKAFVPLVPLILLFLSGPPLELVSVPQRWLVNRPALEPAAVVAGPAGAFALEQRKDPLASSRLIGLAMLVGVGVAALASPGQARGVMRSFFDGAGYGFTHVVSLIVTANCFGKGIEMVGLARHLGALTAHAPDALVPLAGLIPAAFAFLCGSGMATTQSLYGSFHDLARDLGQDRLTIGAMVSVGSAVGRTMSPVAAVTLMVATLTGARAFDLVRRVAVPLLAGLAVAITLRMLQLV